MKFPIELLSFMNRLSGFRLRLGTLIQHWPKMTGIICAVIFVQSCGKGCDLCDYSADQLREAACEIDLTKSCKERTQYNDKIKSCEATLRSDVAICQLYTDAGIRNSCIAVAQEREADCEIAAGDDLFACEDRARSDPDSQYTRCITEARRTTQCQQRANFKEVQNSQKTLSDLSVEDYVGVLQYAETLAHVSTSDASESLRRFGLILDEDEVIRIQLTEGNIEKLSAVLTELYSPFGLHGEFEILDKISSSENGVQSVLDLMTTETRRLNKVRK